MFRNLPVTIVILIFLSAGFTYAQSTNAQTTNRNRYVKIEVRGTLRKQDYYHYVESSDEIFTDTKVRVILERSEDKNHELTKFLDETIGREVIVKGDMDVRRLTDYPGTIYLYFSSSSPISVLEKETVKEVKNDFF